jgi:hypothetical protein
LCEKWRFDLTSSYYEAGLEIIAGFGDIWAAGGKVRAPPATSLLLTYDLREVLHGLFTLHGLRDPTVHAFRHFYACAGGSLAMTCPK